MAFYYLADKTAIISLIVILLILMILLNYVFVVQQVVRVNEDGLSVAALSFEEIDLVKVSFED